MKSFVVAFAVLVLATVASASAIDQNTIVDDSSLAEEMDANFDGSPRFGFLNLNSDGATLTFNSTSLQYAVIIGIILLVVALVVIPLLGLDVANVFAPRDDYEHYYQGYDPTHAYSSYSNYAKRSLEVLSPVLTALSEAYKKYE